MIALYCADSQASFWVEEMRSLMGNKPVVFFWWHQSPDGREETVERLREQLKETGFFPVYVKSGSVIYAFTVVDFFYNGGKPILELPEGVRERWLKSYELAFPWQLAAAGCREALAKVFEKWKEEEKNSVTTVPRILFAVSAVFEVPEVEKIKDWAIYTRLGVVEV